MEFLNPNQGLNFKAKESFLIGFVMITFFSYFLKNNRPIYVKRNLLLRRKAE